jgi:uncharacterized protein (TIGR02996 family)
MTIPPTLGSIVSERVGQLQDIDYLCPSRIIDQSGTRGSRIMRTFVFTDEKSNKFWNIDLQGTRFTVNFGKVGSRGQTQLKDFPDEEKARKAHDKLVAEKLGKGYVETTAGQSPALSPLQQSLEAALAENPDDLAAHSAYADYLMEQGDPRGEFIQVQLALEDPSRLGVERGQIRVRETELLKEHGRQWLGDLGRLLVGEWSGEDKPYHYRFVRGWLDMVRTLPSPDAIIAVLARSPEARLLRRLEVVYDMAYHPFDFDRFVDGPNAALTDEEEQNEIYEESTIMPPLLESPNLSNLRVFKLGFSDIGDRIGHSTMVAPFGDCNAAQVIELLQKCPRLEELYLNTNLLGIEDLFALPALGNIRVLQYYYGTDYTGDTSEGVYPLIALANNASLKLLTTLRLHPGRDATIDLAEMDAVLRSPHLPSLNHLQVHMTTFGDDGCRSIIESGALRRLKVLDIGHGNMTDEGARLLADCPDLKNLEMLDVSRNALTARGIAALRATGVRVVADDQHAADEEDYLYDIDFE